MFGKIFHRKSTLKFPTKSLEKLVINDTTLRDGEQSAGVNFLPDEKLRIAMALSKMGVDIAELGFPFASESDFKSVQLIARQVNTFGRFEQSQKPMKLSVIARPIRQDILTAYESVQEAPDYRIVLFIPSSDIHLKHKLKITRKECITQAVEGVKYCKSLGVADIGFALEDAGRSNRKFLLLLINAIVLAGVSTIHIPDTVGYNTPEEYGSLISYLQKNINPSIVLACHCHNDLGLATANTLAGINNGARQVDVTINGIGERAGNTSLEELVMNLYTRKSCYPVYSTIDTTMIFPTSRLVAELSGMQIQRNKAIVGANAFSHSSGIHQDGMLKHGYTYQIINPETIGSDSNRELLVLGKHSGKHGLMKRVEIIYGVERARELHDTELYTLFKHDAQNMKEGFSDKDLMRLVESLS